MRIEYFVGMLMMAAMNRYPARRSVLHTHQPQDGKRVFNTLGTREAAVGEQTVIADGDAKNAEDHQATGDQSHSSPAEEPRYDRQRSPEMTSDHDRCRAPGNFYAGFARGGDASAHR